MKILVVDDVPSNVALVEARLIAAGIEVSTAFSGRECLEVISREMPDLILLDLMMPGMDGIEVCHHIRSNPDTALIAVVILTATDLESARAEAIAAGANDFLIKPVEDDALFGCIERYAGARNP